MRKITPAFIWTLNGNNDRNLLLSTETNATNTNGFRCFQEIMKQVSEQMLKYNSSFNLLHALYKMKYDGNRGNLTFASR